MRTPVAICLLLTMLVGGVSLARAETRVALVIGNGAYGSQPLSNPPNDAALMAETLRGVGFEVVEEIDADGRRMKRAVRKFGRLLTDAGEDAVGFVFYAGHGIQARGENYMIPVDAQIEDAIDVELEGFPTSTLLASLDNAGNRLNIVVMDACRNNPYKAATRSGGTGLARMDAPSGTLIAYSTSPGKVAADGRGRNSPYTRALARAIQSPGAKVEEVFKSVRVAVMDRTNNAQVPWESSSLTGDFFFIDKEPEPIAVPEPVQPDNTVELTYWNSIKDGTDTGLFESYLAQFPNGLFSGLAKAKISALQRQRASNAQQSDTAFFQAIQNSDDKSDFEAYLSQYPDGIFAALAKARIARIEDSARQVAAASAPIQQPTEDADTAFWRQVKDARTKAELQAYLDQFPNGKFANVAKARLSGIDEQRQVAALTPASAHPLDGQWKAHVRGVTNLEQSHAPFCPYKRPPPEGVATFAVSDGSGSVRVESESKESVTLHLTAKSPDMIELAVNWRGDTIQTVTVPVQNHVAEGKKSTGSNCVLTYRLEQVQVAALPPQNYGPQIFRGFFQGNGGVKFNGSFRFCGPDKRWPMNISVDGDKVRGTIEYHTNISLIGSMTTEEKFRGKVNGIGGGSRFTFKGQLKEGGVELTVGGETAYCSGQFEPG